MGAGRVRLLENIKETGSITKGAEAMKMSYRQAWQMVQDMNKRADMPLVEKILGGKGGGGARITDKGEEAIKLFYQLNKEMEKFSKKIAEKMKIAS